MKSLVKNYIINSGAKTYNSDNYKSISFDQHVEKFSRVLDELSIQNLNIENNLIRNMDFTTSYSVENQAQKIADVLNFNNLEIVKEFSVNVIEKFDTITTSRSKVEEFHQEALSMCKTGELKSLYHQGLENCNSLSINKLEPLINSFSNSLPSDNISTLFQLLDLSKISEFATILSCEHKIILIVGLKVYLPYMFSMYKEGFFINFLKETILKINFRQAKLLYFKPSYLIPTGAIVISGFLFNFGADGKFITKLLKSIREFNISSNEKLNIDIKDYLPTGIPKQIISSISQAGNQLGYALVKVSGSVFKGVMIGIVDNFKEIYQIINKKN